MLLRNLGGWEWVIILVIVLLVFGVGRLSRLGRDLGTGIREFKKGLSENEEAEEGAETESEEG
jgi:sec-independent protein translocase protein TatA